jgi:hypothetical protein
MSDKVSSFLTRAFSLLAWLFVAAPSACALSTEDGDEIEEADDLEAGGALGKADSVNVAGLPVNGSYAATTAWAVKNQWEDRDTPAARAAGIAWPADSGLSWDEKYAAWVQSLEQIPGHTISQTFEITTPWGKTLPAPKLDCADTALMMRASFAAWYGLPFYVVGFDGGTAVYFGHFGIRTKTGNWNGMPQFSQYKDFSGRSAEELLADWPEDSGLRKLGVQAGDDQPFLGEGARTGAYLDELHANKRAGRFIRLLLVFTGSMNLADSRNTYNLAPEALRAGDVMLWRWQAQGVGHTMFTIRVDDIGGGQLEAQSVFGNLPPNQPKWDGPVETKRNYTNPQGGGEDDTKDYAPFNGGLKRFRVAKPVGGVWTNTFMATDEASWVNDTDHDRMHRRPGEIDALLGEADPEKMKEALLGIIAEKRAHLQSFPASCSARIKREEAFGDLYDLMEEHFGVSAEAVDEEFRVLEDYVFAELVYEQSKTCCWNSSTAAMFDTVMDLNAARQEEAGEACVEPVVFKATDGGYEAFRSFRPEGWVAWSEDESCPQRDVVNDAVAPKADGLAFCDWQDAAAGEGDEPPAEEGASCQGRCGGSSSDGTCFCDAQCTDFGDCCGDKVAACG